ncbi:hypothetical protein AB0C34_14650 [Nocardia sp. NPDC049220]|uniref:hypothetical protein n=1 Tax=Nocardia sp. NPDC049220 TaxID=3155273 RepID=UPI0033DF8024
MPVLRAATDPHVRGEEYYGPRGLQQGKGYPKVVRSSPLPTTSISSDVCGLSPKN